MDSITTLFGTEKYDLHLRQSLKTIGLRSGKTSTIYFIGPDEQGHKSLLIPTSLPVMGASGTCCSCTLGVSGIRRPQLLHHEQQLCSNNTCQALTFPTSIITLKRWSFSSS